jgi:hypothetical protein
VRGEAIFLGAGGNIFFLIFFPQLYLKPLYFQEYKKEHMASVETPTGKEGS